jgi:hypothetical protein
VRSRSTIQIHRLVSGGAEDKIEIIYQLFPNIPRERVRQLYSDGVKTALEINDLHTERLFAIFDKDENN